MSPLTSRIASLSGSYVVRFRSICHRDSESVNALAFINGVDLPEGKKKKIGDGIRECSTEYDRSKTEKV